MLFSLIQPPFPSANRVVSVWVQDSPKFIKSASAMLPLINDAVVRFKTLCNVNRAVHSETYCRLIAEAVEEMGVRGE